MTNATNNPMPAGAAGMDEPDGAAFLKELDMALEGQNPEGAHADTARFAAQLAGVLQSQQVGASAELKAKLTPSEAAAKKPSTIVSIDRALARRSRLGMLDWAALFAIVVLGGLIWRGLKTEPTRLEEKKLAAEDTKPPVPPVKKDEAPPVAPEAVAEAIVEDDPANVATARKLERKVSFEFVDTPFHEGLGFLKNLANLNIVVDPKAFEANKTPITLRVQDMSLGVALKWVSRLAGLDYELRDGVVFVSKWLGQSDVELRVLDVADSPIPAKTLAEMLRQLPFEESNPEGSVDALGNLLRITKSRRVHNQMVGIIARLIENRNKATFVLDEEATPWKDEIRKKLKRKVTLEFAETPLEEGVAFLRSLSGVTMIMDPALLGEQPTISLRVTDMDMELVLQWMMRLTKTDYQFRDEAVYIAPAGKLQIQTVFAGYNIGALLKQHKLKVEEVTRMLLETVDPDSWKAAGTGTASGEDWIFVMHTPEVHGKIKQALLKLSQPAKPRLKAPAAGEAGEGGDKAIRKDEGKAPNAGENF